MKWSSPCSLLVDLPQYKFTHRGLMQAQAPICTLQGPSTYGVLSQDFAVKTHSRWDAIYILLGIYAFWTLLYLLVLKLRSLSNDISPSSTIDFKVPRIVNPIHSQEAAQPVANGHSTQNAAFTSPVWGQNPAMQTHPGPHQLPQYLCFYCLKPFVRWVEFSGGSTCCYIYLGGLKIAF